MTHVRKQIRDKIVADLVDASIESVGANVKRTIFFPLEEALFPLIAVYYDPESEAVQTGAMGGKLDREVHLLIEAFAAAVADVEDTLDAIAERIEQTITRKLGGLAYEGMLTSTEFERHGEGDQEVASVRLAYAFRYMTASNDPGSTTH